MLCGPPNVFFVCSFVGYDVQLPLCCVCHLLSRLFHRFNVHFATINKGWAQKCNEFEIFSGWKWWILCEANSYKNDTNILRISFDSFYDFLDRYHWMGALETHTIAAQMQRTTSHQRINVGAYAITLRIHQTFSNKRNFSEFSQMRIRVRSRQ